TVGDIGYAGLQDRHAVTRQYFSVPARAESLGASAESATLRILHTGRHTEKLRTGRLRGNRFRVLVRRVADPSALQAIAAQIDRQGLANTYGAQRFGRQGSTLTLGLALMRGQPPAERISARLMRLALSSVQSALFNIYLEARQRDGLLGRIVPGDVLEDARLGMLVWSVNATLEQARYERREVVPTGPMFGLKMRWPQRDALVREELILSRAGISVRDLARFPKLMHGTRRALVVYPSELHLTPDANGTWLSFVLPSGSYATVLLEELGVDEAQATDD
ncbi:MAG: tRNA pseudouridine(13) synthase TruD, partial [Myxococcota bacterium]